MGHGSSASGNGILAGTVQGDIGHHSSRDRECICLCPSFCSLPLAPVPDLVIVHPGRQQALAQTVKFMHLIQVTWLDSWLPTSARPSSVTGTWGSPAGQFERRKNKAWLLKVFKLLRAPIHWFIPQVPTMEKAELEANNLVQVSCRCWRSMHLSHYQLPPRVYYWETGIKSGTGTQTPTISYGMQASQVGTLTSRPVTGSKNGIMIHITWMNFGYNFSVK